MQLIYSHRYSRVKEKEMKDNISYFPKQKKNEKEKS